MENMRLATTDTGVMAEISTRDTEDEINHGEKLS